MGSWRLVIFLTVFLALVVLTHRYLYSRLVVKTALPPLLRRSGKWALIGLALMMAGGLIVTRFLARGSAEVLSFLVFSWMGVIALLVPALAFFDLLRAPGGLGRWWRRRRARRAGQADAPEDPARRALFARGTAAAATLGSLAVTGAGVQSALGEPVIREVEVSIPHLPAAFKGLRIVQVSDIHVGSTITRPFVERMVRIVNAQRPDLVAITGDLVDGSVERLSPAVAELEKLQSRFGTFFCTGNHDYYSGADAWCAYLRQIGVQVLRNQRQTLEKDGQAIDILGVDDWGGDHDLAAAVAGRDPGRVGVLLAHQPRAVKGAAEAGIDLVLSGHTHGGQIWPYGLFVKLVQPYVRGLHAHTERTRIYVHPGTGYWGPPVRVGVEPEVAVITLV